MSSAPYRFHAPTEVLFGADSLTYLPERAAARGSKPLIVTGRHFARAAGLLGRIQEMLPSAAVFDAAEENPTTMTCERGATLCRTLRCDLVIGVGGGSAIDSAKAIAMLARNTGRAAEHFGWEQFQGGALPLMAIPTTAGTGSEVTPYSVLVDSQRWVKRTVGGRSLFPRTAFLDPALTVSLPRDTTVATGLDALSQGMEGMLSLRASPATDPLALEVCRLVRAWLPVAAANPDHLDARGAMLHAAMLSGIVIAQTGTTLVHGMGYYFTLEFGISHGLANALVLAPVFQHNARHEPAKVAALAEALGVPGNDPEADIAAAIHGLLHDLGIDPAASSYGVDLDALRSFAEDLHADPYRFKNQVGDFSIEDLQGLFEAAYYGGVHS